MIDILIPVLDRPQNAAKVVDSIEAATVLPHTITFLITCGDLQELRAVKAASAAYLIAPWPSGRGDFARKTNLGFGLTYQPFVFLGADDLDFKPGWDEAAIVVAESSGAGVIGTQDDCNPLTRKGRHSTHSLVRRSYIEEQGGTFDETPGIVYAECYDHQWVDNELVVVAQARGEWAFAEGAVVEHLHPLDRRKRVAVDATYRKGLAHGREDADLHRRRRIVWERERKRHPART